MPRNRYLSLVAAAAVLAVGAGCGGDDDTTTAPPTTSQGRPATLGVAKSDLGSDLVDSQGRTLYLFQKDTGTRSECTGACAAQWPPLRSGDPVAGSGLTAAKVGTTQRPDGKPQVTYDGHPLYRFGGDQKAGQTNGQGLTAFGGSWFALAPSGNEITTKPSNSGGGFGY